MKGTQSNALSEEVTASVFCSPKGVLRVNLHVTKLAAQLYSVTVAGFFL